MEIEFLRNFQGISNPFLDVFFESITMFGEELLLVPILAFIYWTLDKDLGEYLGFSIFLSFLSNNVLKDTFKFNRPIGEEGIRSLRIHSATGYSFPSGHSQGAATFWWALYLKMNKKIYSLFFALIIFLVGISRLYLGLHYPKDVIAGITIGIIISYTSFHMFNKTSDRFMLYFIILLIFIPVLSFSASHDFIKSLGAYTGFLFGIFVEKKFINFSINGCFLIKTIRLLIGIFAIFILKEGLKLIFPNMMFFEFLRYSLITFFAFAFYPFIFKKYKF